MTDQLFDDFRKSSESLLAMQEDVFKRWQRLLLAQLGVGERGAWEQNLQKRARELMVTMLNKHREFIDATYRSHNELFEQALRAAEATSPDEYRHIVDDLRRKSLATLREQSESRIRELYNMADEAFEYTRKAAAL
jgi:hypothetical protein